MSGICAIVNFDGAPVDPEVLRAMAEQCAYRGPDGIRYWIHGNVGFAHLALHATPESLREIQPQLSEDGTLCLTADVRVDNRPELINLLTAKGQPVRFDATDADLILAAYRTWGESCPLHIIGDFAFAIWDAKEQKLFCARDVYGVKSLHYARVGSTLCVASEAQQIIQHPEVPRNLDEIAVADFMVSNYNDEGRTMFLDVWAIRRAHFLVANSSGQKMERYWDVDPERRITYKNEEEYAAHFLEIFQRTVKDHLRTQGKTIGITMSGGLDSTSVAAVAQQILNHQPDSPHLLACSYIFDQLKECDESYYSRAMADELGIDLIHVPAENFWTLDNNDTYTPSLETPSMGEESLTRHMLGIFKEQGARVWLTGHGGDSLLIGSPLLYADRLRHGDISALLEVAYLCKQYNLPFSKLLRIYRRWFLRPLIPEFLLKPRKKETVVPEWLDADFVHRTRIVERLAHSSVPKRFSEHARQEIYKNAVYIDTIQMAINRAERQGACHNMEVRHPFLDRRLVEFLVAIPPRQLSQFGFQKFILRIAMRGILPEVVRTRPDKTQFSSYMRLGLGTKEPEKVKALLTPPLQNHGSLVYSSTLQEVFESCLSEGNSVNLFRIWHYISLELWLGKYGQLFNNWRNEHE